ncbi:MAG: Stp1/IreP family PP2C-type Ser/Thr phosphatase [Lachnospiraceae bacterium]|nr:Stp1/IreP family PP2C-type Ser/Thr phosphatase [Lachnospiraceae bacterium]
MISYALTDVGRTRQSNQDFYFVSDSPIGPLPNLFVIADGMGGHNAGDFASRFCTESVVSFMRNAEEASPADLFPQAVAAANEELLAAASRDPELTGTGTTLILASLTPEGHLTVSNVGDSRVYLIRDSIEQLTRDHSYVEKMVSMGKMKVGSAEYMRKKNLITRAVGAANAVPDIFEADLAAGDRVLMCTDGLTNMVSDEEILHVFRTESSVPQIVQKLVDMANVHGGRDNITALVIEA